MRLNQLWVADYRNYPAAELALAPGLTVIVGDNGAGKTNLLEAIGYLATLSSFRGSPNDALVRAGASQAVVRGEGERGGRALLLEAEIKPAGRGRITVNRQPVRRSAELAATLRATVFSPDDLELVKGGPTGRRRYLDDILSSLHPRNEAARRDYERVVRQRNALLAQAAKAFGHAGGARLSPEIESTLDVWDARLVETGEAVGTARTDLVAQLEPALAKAYSQVAGVGAGAGPATMTYEAPWREAGLEVTLRRCRRDELRRGVSLVGPHRDELALTISGMPARTHASQGEQRSLALALRLAAHDVLTEALAEAPLLLLDDVFSELDATRTQALLHHLPGGQSVLTTTADVPPGAEPQRVVRVADGRVLEDAR